jgi:hypothetical protein
MDISGAILTYFIVLVVVYLVLSIFVGIRWWSSLAIAVLLAFVVMLAVYPIGDMISHQTMSNWVCVYFFVVVLTMIVIILYVLTSALTDFEDEHRCEEKALSSG